MNNQTHVLGASLLRARLGQTATTPSTEQQLVHHLCADVASLPAPMHDLVRAAYVAIKARCAVCMYGAPLAHTLPVLEMIAAAIVGANNDQIVKLAVPPPHDFVARRFAALRMAELVQSALDDAQRDKAFFVLLHGDDGTALMQWAHAEITAALHAEAPHSDAWPTNVVVLGAARTVAVQPRSPWLALHAPARLVPPVPQPHSVPPVGYQRQLIASRLPPLTSVVWRNATDALAADRPALPPTLVWRWLLAAVDGHGCGLWVHDDPHANAQRAVAVLRTLALPPA
jgi:hypothetical protein